MSHSCIFSASNYTLIGDGSVCEQLERGGYTQPVYSTALQYLTLVFSVPVIIHLLEMEVFVSSWREVATHSLYILRLYNVSLLYFQCQ